MSEEMQELFAGMKEEADRNLTDWAECFQILGVMPKVPPDGADEFHLLDPLKYRIMQISHEMEEGISEGFKSMKSRWDSDSLPTGEKHAELQKLAEKANDIQIYLTSVQVLIALYERHVKGVWSKEVHSSYKEGEYSEGIIKLRELLDKTREDEN